MSRIADDFTAIKLQLDQLHDEPHPLAKDIEAQYAANQFEICCSHWLFRDNHRICLNDKSVIDTIRSKLRQSLKDERMQQLYDIDTYRVHDWIMRMIERESAMAGPGAG